MIKKIQLILSNPITSGTLVMVAGSMGINIVNYIYHLIMGRVLGPAHYGALASIYSILYIVSIIPQSSSITIVKFISAAKSDAERAHIFHEVHRLVQKVALWGSLFLILISIPLQHFLNVDSLFAVLCVAPIFYFSITTTVNQAAMQGTLSFTGVVITNLVSSLGKLILGLLFIWFGWALGGAILAVAIGVFMAYVISKKYIKKLLIRDKLKENIFQIKTFITYSGPVIVQALAFTSLFTVDVILVKHFFGDFDAGLYAALSTLGKIIFFAASPITSVMFPIVSRNKSEGKNVKKVFFITLGITIGVSFTIVLMYWLLPSLTITLLYGTKYISAASNLVWMGLFIAIYTVSQQIVNYFLSIDIVHIVIIPAIAAILQILLIWFFHNSILQVLQISVYIVSGMTVLLLGFLAYNHS